LDSKRPARAHGQGGCGDRHKVRKEIVDYHRESYTDKICSSTGGIGREIVKHLGLKGAKVYCTARSESRSKATIDGIHKEHPEINGQLIPLMVDFNSPESVQDVVAELKKKERHVDILSKSNLQELVVVVSQGRCDVIRADVCLHSQQCGNFGNEA
jgi:hypothetical protein